MHFTHCHFDSLDVSNFEIEDHHFVVTISFKKSVTRFFNFQ